MLWCPVRGAMANRVTGFRLSGAGRKRPQSATQVLSLIHILAISNDSRLVAAGFEDGRIKVIELATGSEIKRLERHGAQVWCLAFAPNGKVLASTSFDKTVRQWDLATGKELSRFQPEGHLIECLAYTPDGSEIRVGHANSLIHGWQLK